MFDPRYFSPTRQCYVTVICVPEVSNMTVDKCYVGKCLGQD